MAALGLDLIRLFLLLAGKLAGQAWRPLLAAKKAVPLALLLAFAMTTNSIYMAYHPRLTKIEFPTTKLPAGVDSLRIGLVSDIHLSRFIRCNDLKYMLNLYDGFNLDFLVLTGDVVDTDMTGRMEEAELLAALKPRYGLFAVMGNHERYTGEKNALDFFHRAGVRVLRGEIAEAGGLVLAGLDDESFGGSGDGQTAEKLLSTLQLQGDPRFILLLKHRPALAQGTAGLFDLQLSGHTHGGQIWPAHFLIKKINGALKGLNYDASSRSAVYTTSGAGFWGLPMRFMAPAEVALIELRRK
jgi:predicted MPP superfamily phosphohydrolase